MKRYILLVGFTVSLLAVALLHPRRPVGDWQATKSAIGQWTAENTAYTERLKRGLPRDPRLEDELGDRIKALLWRYERERKW